MRSHTFSSRSRSPWRGGALLDAADDVDAPLRALAARRALAAALVAVELRHPQGQLHHAGAVVDHDHRARSRHRARRGDRLVVDAGVELVGHEQRRGRAARDDRLDRAPARRAAAEALDQVAQRRGQRQLVVAGPLARCRRARTRACPSTAPCRSRHRPRRPSSRCRAPRPASRRCSPASGRRRGRRRRGTAASSAAGRARPRARSAGPSPRRRCRRRRRGAGRPWRRTPIRARCGPT